MYNIGIDQHKITSYLITVDEKGIILQQANLKNNSNDILNYFNGIKGRHSAIVETTGGWYLLNDLLESNNISFSLAHTKFVKAIAYASVKTDKVDSQILA